MLCFKPLSFLVLQYFLFLSSAFFSNGLPDNHQISTRRFQVYSPGIIKKDGQGMISNQETTRWSVLGDNRADGAENNTLILAAKRTKRRDPLDNFKYYRGGWNISNKHYISSIAYAATPLLAIAIIWCLGFAVTLLVICIRLCCCQLNHDGQWRTAYVLSLAFLMIFAVATIVGSIVLYTGEENFHGSTTNTLDYIVEKAYATIENLTTVSDYLAAAKGAGVDGFFLHPTIQENIVKVQKMINSSAVTLQNATDTNSDKIHNVLDSVRVALIIVSTVMLLLVFLGFLLSVWGPQVSVYILAVIGWILVTIALLLCFIFLILHNVVGDTCIAMDDWVQNPQAHTALDDILPCVDSATSQQILSQSKNVTFRLICVGNLFITSVANINPPPNLPPEKLRRLYYNQSGPLVPVLCNPYNSDMTDQACAPGEIELSNATQELRKYICQVSENETCTTTGRLTPTFYNQMVSIANIVYTLHNYGPFLVELVDCTFVRETFGDISEHYCPGLNRFSGFIFVGLVMVSGAVMFSLVLWMFYARESRHQIDDKQFQTQDF